MAKHNWMVLLLAAALLAITIGVYRLPKSSQKPAPSPITIEASSSQTSDSFRQRRQEMVEIQIRERGVTDTLVLKAMETVLRHEFVPSDQVEHAYYDSPLPIGYGQTISQPYIVALMTELASIKPGDKILEIGTGSGYQAAILAQITDKVYSIEIIPALAARARATLDRLGYQKIVSRQGDGYFGWEEEAPFAAILVTAAPDHVPPPLRAQLKEGGRLVIPVGPPGGYQSLWVITRHGDEFPAENMGGVMFVPLLRQGGE